VEKVFVCKGTFDLSFIRVNPGEWVVLKPNLVKECKLNDPSEWECVVTSAALIAQVCEYVCLKLRGSGRVTICDAPQTDSSFARIAELLHLSSIAEDCQRRFGVTVEVVDLRREEWTATDEVITHRQRLPGDPRGSIAFNLGRDSLFYQHGGEGRYYGADYDAGVVNEHHHGDVHEYLISATPILADVFINLPKLKTHKKTGVTLSLKNLVGINADKNWLPHHTEGSPRDGGDQYPDLTTSRRAEQMAVGIARSLALKVPRLGPAVARRLRRSGKRVFGDTNAVVRSGNWHGNDTTWRMVLDLNRCLLYGQADGTLAASSNKRYYTVVDGRVGMEGNGPMHGDAVNCGVVLGGSDPVAVDMVAARVMGFDWRKIPMIRQAFGLDAYPITRITPDEVMVESDVAEWNGRFVEVEELEFFTFRAHFGWAGAIEYRLSDHHR
jgi:uncharacterized protein (DUF362 family)